MHIVIFREMLILVVLLLINHDCFVFCNDLDLQDGDRCQFPDGSEGICTIDRDCPGPIELFKQNGPQPQICSFESFSAYICCPNRTAVTSLITKFSENNPLLYTRNKQFINEGDNCTLLDGTPGICKDGSDSRDLFNALKLKNTRPVLCAELLWELTGGTFKYICTPENAENLPISDLSAEKSSVKFCRKYFPSNFKPVYGSGGAAGGTKVSLGDYPYMAAIGWLFSNESAYDWNCGGSLISENFIVTAAHCGAVPDTIKTYKSLEPVVVRVGVILLTNNFEDDDLPIESIFLHPLYKPPFKYHDIALMRLSKSPIFTDFVKPICLFQSVKNSGYVRATGWGKISIAGPRSADLLRVVLNVVESKNCTSQYSDNKRQTPRGIIDGQICAAHPLGQQDTCKGDSGGPLISFDEELFGIVSLLGVTSYGIGCGNVTTPGVYTRISSYVNWIESIVWPNSL